MAEKIHYVQEVAGPGIWTVTMFPLKGDKKEFTVRGNTCTCEGFSARAAGGEVCKHVALVQKSESTVAGKEVSHSKARAIYARIGEKLEPAVLNLHLDELVAGISGKITLIKISGDPKEPPKGSHTGSRVLRAFVDGVKVEVLLR